MINTNTEENKIEFIGKTNIKNFKKHEYYINDAQNKRIIYFGDDGKEKITNNLCLESVELVDNDITFNYGGAEELSITTDNTFTGDVQNINQYLYFDADYNICTGEKTIINTRILEFMSVIIHDFVSSLDPDFVTEEEPVTPEEEPVEE